MFIKCLKRRLLLAVPAGKIDVFHVNLEYQLVWHERSLKTGLAGREISLPMKI